jgi:hypothetical protein
MVVNVVGVTGVTPARDRAFERSRFYYGASSTATGSTGINWAANCDLLGTASSGNQHIFNYSTNPDMITVQYHGTAAASSFAMQKWSIDTTTITQTITISTAVVLANTFQKWNVVIGPREEMTFLATTMSSGAYYNLYTMQAFGFPQ